MYNQINLSGDEERLKKGILRAKERGIRIPTFRQMKDPDKETPAKVKEGLKETGLWDVNPLNLFRITWKNEPTTRARSTRSFAAASTSSSFPAR